MSIFTRRHTSWGKASHGSLGASFTSGTECLSRHVSPGRIVLLDLLTVITFLSSQPSVLHVKLCLLVPSASSVYSLNFTQAHQHCKIRLKSECSFVVGFNGGMQRDSNSLKHMSSRKTPLPPGSGMYLYGHVLKTTGIRDAPMSASCTTWCTRAAMGRSNPHKHSCECDTYIVAKHIR